MLKNDLWKGISGQIKVSYKIISKIYQEKMA